MFRYASEFKGVILFFIGLSVIISLQQVVGAQENVGGDEPILPDTPYEYANLRLPDHFDAGNITDTDNTPPDNPVTNEAATLGRVLFYDVKLSANDSTSCASCHLQEFAFSDPNQFSIGFEGELTARNSMGLTHARYYERGAFFWDERAPTLEEQALLPIQDPIELGLDLETLETKLAATSYYPPLFEAAFGTAEVNSERVARALAQFMRSMVSYQSRFDEGMQNNFEDFTEQEKFGQLLFEAPATNCEECHLTSIQIANQPRNNGLDAETIDPGAGDATFKVPSLRNVELTGPYMHDGRFETLEEVIDFYSTEIEAHPNLDPLLEDANGEPRRINFSPSGKAAIIAFLKTLTDNEFTTDIKYSNPFIGGEGPTATPSPSMTATSTPSPSMTATSTLSPSMTATSTLSPSMTATSTPSPSMTAISTPSPSMTATSTPSPSMTTTSTPSPSMTATSTPSPSITATSTPSPSVTATNTIVAPTATATSNNYNVYLPLIIR